MKMLQSNYFICKSLKTKYEFDVLFMKKESIEF